MTETQQLARSVSELLEHCAYRIRISHFESELPQAQWLALRFFEQCNAGAASVTSFAALHGLTAGTASRTVTHLVRKGLLSRRSDPADGRRWVLRPTAKGRRALGKDPLRNISAALSNISPDKLHDLADTLNVVVVALASSAGEPAKAPNAADA